MATPKTIDTTHALTKLAQANLDSYAGFSAAAEEVNDQPLKELFTDLAAERKKQADRLRGVLAEQGETPPDDSPSALAKSHHWWLKARAKVSPDDAKAVLEEAERGEDHIKHAYEEQLKEVAGADVTDLLNDQYAAVKRGHDRIRDLRDVARNES